MKYGERVTRPKLEVGLKWEGDLLFSRLLSWPDWNFSRRVCYRQLPQVLTHELNVGEGMS